MSGLALWHSGQSCHRQCQHPIWVWVCVLATQFLIQFPTTGLEKAVENDLGVYITDTHVADLGVAPGSCLWPGPVQARLLWQSRE